MEYRVLEINVISASDLKKSNLFTKMDAYAVVSLSGDPRLGLQKFKTNVDRQGGTDPSWNFPVKFRIDEAAAKQNRLTITFLIRCKRALGDKDIGTVVVPVQELYDGTDVTDGAAATQMKSVTYQVRKPSGKPKGALYFSYKFGETEKIPYVDPAAAVAAVPVAYPAGTSAAYPPPPPPHPAYAYPAQPYPGNAYGGYPPPPPQPGYVYPPPPQAGYGYPQPQQQRNRNNMGLGLGAGLLGGVLGGLLIGDLVSDAGAYDAGYDGGFGDGMGF
ncbi:hypothetical protein MLD38_038854 [Melastoma candidum]|uniref:Uncharacterized protein n=1 Tax=Melastoma candidum TaxID=119954 RepID=A0ACB9L2J5_9MYRT|nr:hypothetical protein MLD38_038854 [Melastoma candidum]